MIKTRAAVKISSVGKLVCCRISTKCIDFRKGFKKTFRELTNSKEKINWYMQDGYLYIIESSGKGFKKELAEMMEAKAVLMIF